MRLSTLVHGRPDGHLVLVSADDDINSEGELDVIANRLRTQARFEDGRDGPFGIIDQRAVRG